MCKCAPPPACVPYYIHANVDIRHCRLNITSGGGAGRKKKVVHNAKVHPLTVNRGHGLEHLEHQLKREEEGLFFCNYCNS